MTEPRKCPECGTALPPDAPEGLCVKCLYAAALLDQQDRHLHIRCPHCHQPVEIVDDAPLAKLMCPSCHSQFSVIGEPTVAYEPEKPSKIGHFKLLERIGMGAFGTVWKARDEQLDRTVAIKIPRKGQLSPEETELFLREARAAAQVKHPHIVNVHEIGRQGDTTYIVSDFVDGVSLADWLTGGKFTPREAAELCAQIADALHHAHEAGVVHRDLKPSNIMLEGVEGRELRVESQKTSGSRDSQPSTFNLRPVIMDFGLAKREAGEVTMTVEGKVLGTPAYMSPEQARGEAHAADRRSDVYSLGVILFELLTGEQPFRGNMRMLLHQVIHDEPPNPRKLNSAAPRDLETICLKCLQKEPERRYPSAAELAADLRRFLEHKPIVARPTGRVERAVRWCRRNPVVASLTAAVALVLVAGTAVSTIFAIQLNSKAKFALEQMARADTKADEADANAKQAMRRSYISDMRLAQRAWEDSQMQRVRELLDGQRPDRTGGTDLRNFEWHFLDRRCRDELRSFPGENGAVAFSPDGKRLAVSGWGEVTIRDLATGEVIVTRKSTGHMPRALDFSPDGKTLAWASWLPSPEGPSELTIWDGLSGTKIQTIHVDATGMSGVGNGIAFSPDGTRVAGYFDGYTETNEHEEKIVVWELATGKEVFSRKHEGTQVRFLVFSPDGTRLAVRDNDRVAIWELATGDTTLTLDELDSYGQGVAFSPSGNWLAVATHQTLNLWDLVSEKVFTFDGHTDSVWSVAFSPDGTHVATAGMDQTVRMWDLSTGEQVFTFKGHAGGIRGLAFSYDGRLLASSGDDGVKIWDATSHAEALEGPTSGDIALLRPDGQLAASVGGKSWDADGGDERLKIAIPPSKDAMDGPSFGGFSPDGKWLVSSQDLDVTLWNSQTGQPIHTFQVKSVDDLHPEFETHFPINLLALGPDGHTLAIGHNAYVENLPCPIQMWNLTFKGEQAAASHRFTLEGHEDWINSMAFSPDGRRLASTDFPGYGFVWDVATGKQLVTLDGGIESGTELAFNPDGTRLAGCVGNSAVVWDAATGRVVHTLKGHNETVQCVAFGPDGTRLASGTAEFIKNKVGVVKIWDVASGQETLSFPVHTAGVGGISFSPDGLRLAISGWDVTTETARRWIWDARPLIDEVRLEREARSLYDFAMKRVALKDEMIEHIRRDPTVSEPVRKLALVWSERYRETAAHLNAASWIVAPRSGNTPAAYALALRQAEAACRLEPNNADFLSTLGAAQYRVGKYAEALTTLTRAIELHQEQYIEPVPWDLKFLAMTQHQLGQQDQAQTTLKQLQEIMKHPDWSAYPSSQPFLREAEEVVGLVSDPTRRNKRHE